MVPSSAAIAEPTVAARITPVMGTNNLERISMLSDAEKVELDRQDWFFLYESALGHEVP